MEPPKDPTDFCVYFVPGTNQPVPFPSPAPPPPVERDRVAKVGAAACKHCGGAGGGSDWAKTFATALCDIFDCPAMVEREASRAPAGLVFVIFITKYYYPPVDGGQEAEMFSWLLRWAKST